ncbi:reverse transcriptase domain-containing protein [Citrus sinensis]|nr:reverse transcriptase domain-containing protein [Citrus sinensis]
MAANDASLEHDVNRGYANISLEEEEEGGLIVVGDEEIGDGKERIDSRFCLVGRFLTDKVINFAAMKHTMASLWRPGKGVCIRDLSPTLFLFQFFHEIDVKRVLESGPWTFDQHILLVKRLEENEQPQNIPLFFTSFWIQVYNLPVGFMSEKILKDIGSYIGVFVASDENNLMGIWKNYMRIRVTTDVRKPLKRRMKLKKAGGDWLWIDFKYERLNIFCFICGLLGHTEKQCPKLYESPYGGLDKPYGHWLKAPTRRSTLNYGDRWLRSVPPTQSEKEDGKSTNQAVAMQVDSGNTNKSGVAVPSSLIIGKHAGIMVPFQEGGEKATKGNNSKGKSTEELAHFSREKENVEELESGLVVSEAKRRRSQDQIPHIGGFDGEGTSQSGEFQLGSKNGLAVGPVIQAHRVPELGKWRLTGFYGFPESSRRRESWDLLRLLAGSSNLPWLIDLGVTGYQFTWERARGTDKWVEERLDRALVSESWLHRFNEAKVFSLESTCSDHLPILLELQPTGPVSRNKRFRFENVWLREIDCCEVVRNNWLSPTGSSIQQKILSCGAALMDWGGYLARDFRKRKLECRKQMALLRGRRDCKGITEFTKVRNRYNELLHGHEVFWKQRAKSLWLKEGDKNTHYFHASASTRKRQNSFGNLRNNQGDWCTNVEEVDEVIINYFHNLFQSNGCNSAEVIHCVETKITNEQNSMLLTPFSATDVKEALFDMHPDKSPGPDGMNPAFYQRFWHIVGEDVISACLQFVKDCSFPAGLNDTSLVLIPKNQKPEILSDMRPIALCNVLYKIISKMLANRMKLVLDLVISDSQSAFVPVRYSVLREGKEVGPIIPCRGLRQGDPLSPYLFIICAEGLSSLFRSQERSGLLHGVKVARGAPMISHLFFADDSFLFFKATHNEAALVKQVLTVYGKAAGQVVNFSKSSISFSANVSEANVWQLCELLEVNATTNHGAYLGLSSYIGRKKKEVFHYIRDRVWKRLQGWSAKMLSRAGKEILLKTVALAMPNYAISVYLLPKDLCRELEGMMNSYWWRNNHSSGKGINWMKWKYLCNPKGHGGLRFKQLHSFNIALLRKQVWHILTRPESLMSKVLKARYFPRTSVLKASLGHNPSFVWRSMLAAKDVVVQGSRLQVGSGHNISIGNDPWLPDITDGFISTELNEELAAAPVDCLMVPNQRIWDFDVVSDLFNARDKELILQIPLSSRRDNDAWYWQANPRGCYTVRSCYKLLNPITSDSFAGVWRKLWRLNVPSKIKNFIWRAAKNVLPTAVNLLSRRVDIISTCAVCNANEETVMHALIECSFAKTCWFSSPVGFVGYCTSFLTWLEHIFAYCSADDCNIAMMICWRIWIHRNDKIWNQKNGSVLQLAHGAVSWEKPEFGWVKCNVDAAVFASQGRIGLGCVIRNSEGEFLAARCVGRHGAFSAREAEALGIREALSWLKEYKLPCVIVEMDCLQVFQALTEGFSGPNGFGLIIEDCRELALVLGEVKFSFVRRSANFAAHSVARAGNSMTDSRVWNCAPPPWLLNSL